MAYQFISIDYPVLLRPLKLHPSLQNGSILFDTILMNQDATITSSFFSRTALSSPEYENKKPSRKKNAMIKLMIFYITASILISNTRTQNTNRIKTILRRGKKTKFGPTFYVFYLKNIATTRGIPPNLVFTWTERYIASALY